jgi:hypothetical protein
MPITHQSSPAEKIALFRSLFRGREEVWPLRLESVKTGKSGYSPVCGNEWVRGICEKPRIKCSDCRFQKWLPVTDEVIRRHLSGVDDRGRAFVAGVYPMLLDELRVLWRIIHERQFISQQQLLFAITKIDEIGRMTGGWLKSLVMRKS